MDIRRLLAIVTMLPAMAFAGTVTVQLDGCGRVTSDVGGIDCPGTCVSSEVTGSLLLTATPLPGCSFTSWVQAGNPVFQQTLTVSSLGSPTIEAYFQGQPPFITSDNNTTRAVGAAGSFALTAIGGPEPTISVTGTWPAGVTYDAATQQLVGRPLAGSVGDYSLQVTASNGIGPPVVQAFTFTVTKATQTIQPPSAGRSARGPNDPPFDLDAFATSFLPLTFTSNTPALCSVSGARVTLTGQQGDCEIAAAQPGDASFLAATPITFKIRVDSARVERIAGGGVRDGASAIDAPLAQPLAAVVATGKLLIADAGQHRVRAVVTSQAATFAGTGVRGFAGDGGPATAARLDSPGGLAADGSGNVYIADTGNHRIRKVAANGTITTIAGNGRRAITGSGGLASAASLASPRDLAIDAAGNLYFVEEFRLVRRITPGGTIEAVAGNVVVGYYGDGGPAQSSAFASVRGLAVDASGNLYVSDTTNFRVRRITGGTISTYAGDGTGIFGVVDGNPAAATPITNPTGLAFDGAGNLLVAEFTSGRVRRVDLSTTVVGTVAGGASFPGAADGSLATDAHFGQPIALAAGPSNTVHVVEATLARVRTVTIGSTFFTAMNQLVQPTGHGDGGPARNARLASPSGIARDAAGNTYVADRDDNRVRKITPGGTITTFAGNGTFGFSGDGGPATSAQLDTPSSVAVDTLGNVYIADRGNFRIRRVTPLGVISTVAGNGASGSTGDGGPATAASMFSPDAIAVAPDGSLHILEGSRVRRVSGGNIHTVAGTGLGGYSGDGLAATTAQIAAVNIAFDALGNLYIADFGNNRVRRVSQGVITTIAGTGASISSGDGGPASSAGIRGPLAVALDPFGNLYIAENSNVIRKVDRDTSIITSLTLRGLGAAWSEDVPPGAVTVGRPEGLIADDLGDVYIADTPLGLVMRVAFDSQPNAFTFASQGAVATGSTRTSATITPSGYDAMARVRVTGGEYSVGCSGTFTSQPGGMKPGQSICVRHTASVSAGTTTTTTLSIGGVQGTFSSTTAAAPPPPNPPRLGNISTRMQVLTGNDVMIGGFVIGGSANKTVAIVATGPSLVPFGITNALANPTLTLVRSSDQSVIASNDDWQSAANQAQLSAAGFAPSDPLEAAILVSLPPGAYTAIVQGAAGGTGVAVAGVYEVDHPEIPLTNISTRGRVLTGNDVMIGGFVIQGSGPQTLAIVATGPSLAPFGITSPLANPKITLVRSSDQVVIDSNDDWQAHPNFSFLQGAGFAPTNPLESGILTTLPPGAYTVVVEGVGGGTGVAVIGVYRVN